MYSSFEYSTENHYQRMKHVNLLYKDFQRFFTMLPNEKYSFYIPLPSHWFLFKFFSHFLLKTCQNSIRRCKLCSYFCSTFQNYLRKFCQIITWDLFIIPSSQKPIERRKAFPMWYVRGTINRFHGTEDHSIWKTSKLFNFI